ncbi:MAG: glycoside hydrolase family 20 zincin-like fold domain-containing protein, partial [Bryobacteraceae bacterium]
MFRFLPFLPLLAMLAPAAVLDLSHAVVTLEPNATAREKKAATVLVEEVEKRTRLRLPISTSTGEAPVISLGRGSGPADGYRLQVSRSGVSVRGNDERGVLFGVGRLLREMHMDRDRLGVEGDLSIASAPKYPLRGHQLGYRPKTNAYDGWSVPMWDQYIRDLAIFGTNAVELIPPRSDDAADSPHFPLPPMEMMVEMSRIADSYGLDVWIWYPAMDKDYSDPKTVDFALKEWAEVFKRLPRIDAVFVPGGDPGHTEPKYLLGLLEKETPVLHRYHPKAQMWVSPQSFSQPWLEEFFQILNRDQPAWLSGVVFGPQINISLPKLRAAVPAKYPIRRYPDITHSVQSQYPVPDWDIAYAATEARETINPRPVDETNIFRLFQSYGIGFITYSEGCNDDVNKFIWSALGWDPERKPIDILRDFSKYFIGDRFADSFAQGLMALERDWRGPLETNESVYTTLEQFQSMEREATPQVKENWRFQQGLYRAYYDAYTRRRLLFETAAERTALDKLRDAPRIGATDAMAEAEQVLDKSLEGDPWRARTFELAEALFQSIHMQLSVPRYQAIAVGRGANLDTIDRPLNNRVWLKLRFDELRKMNDEASRMKGLDEILNWTNPGPGGFYDDLGDLTAQPHLVRRPGYKKDPAFLESSMVGFAGRPYWPKSWWTHAGSLNDTPLEMRYTGLDPNAEYKIRVVYAGDSPSRKIRLTANGDIEIHGFIEKPQPVA